MEVRLKSQELNWIGDTTGRTHDSRAYRANRYVILNWHGPEKHLTRRAVEKNGLNTEKVLVPLGRKQ